jgi:hypothetical protein
MYASAPNQRRLSHSTDTFLVPDPLPHLKALRKKADRISLYHAIVLGGSFIEGLGLLWFQKALAENKVEFHWKNNFPHIEMRHVLALLNSINLINDDEYKEFRRAADYRNQIVHRMYSQWVKPEKELESNADLIIKCVENILSRAGQPVRG